MTPWIKLDDGLHSHPKIIEAWSIDRAGVGLHLRALSYADHLTDGHIRESWVAELFRVESERTSAGRSATTKRSMGTERRRLPDPRLPRVQRIARRCARPA